jgi:apolipoprotein N-acyltransferase
VINAYAQAALAGILMAYSHDRLPWLCVVGIALICGLVHEKKPREVLRLALVFSAVESVSFWAFAVVGPVYFIAAWGMHLAFRLFFVASLPFAFRFGRHFAWAASCFWVGIEFLRTQLSLNPAPLGDAFAKQLWFIQIADLGGTYLVSFVLVFCATSLFMAVNLRRLRMLAPALLIMTASIAYSSYRLHEKPKNKSRAMKIAIVQASIPIWFYKLAKIDSEFSEMLTRSYSQSLDNAPRDELLVWPETALPWDPLRHAELQTILSSTLGPSLLAGLPRRDAQGRDFNTAWFFSKHKAHTSKTEGPQQGVASNLVPPTRKAEEPRSKQNASGGRPVELALTSSRQTQPQYYDKRVKAPIIEADLARGSSARILGDSNWKTAVLICWESVFPHLYSQAESADAIAVLTDLAAFELSDMAELHARKTVLRAIEQRRPAIHASQVGPSQLMDAQGRIQAELLPWQVGVVRAKLSSSSQTSLYSISKGGFAPIISALAIFLFLLARKRRSQ